MEDLKKLGFFDGTLSEDEKKKLIEKKQKEEEAFEALANPTPGK